MPSVTRFSVAKTQRSYSPDGLAAVKGSTVTSVTADLRSAYAVPAENTTQLEPTT